VQNGALSVCAYVTGLYAQADYGPAISGRAADGVGVLGTASFLGGAGVVGLGVVGGEVGVEGYAEPPAGGVGVLGIAPSDGGKYSFAGDFEGDVNVSGTIYAGTKDFKIDHPMDPANKYLLHSSVESSETMNIYNGNAVLDEQGEVWVSLPAWFEVLNRDFRYQLTCVGGFAPIYISEEIKANRFKIAGGKPRLKVSWQVTGIRQDAYAKAHPIVVEQSKRPSEQGFYIFPEGFGQPQSKAIAESYRVKLAKLTRKNSEATKKAP
jgi:trimeric autotransporter adhesin